ncbi:CPBP family intramembrane metalloprotease [Candidatus Woesebacteria bacterium]|nr:MAG: CPBP family intramembrane metalloprotease [Candidatus Woesebacteria bacterium]
MSRVKTIVSLTMLPFLITGIERLIIAPVVTMFSLPDTSITLIKVATLTIILLAISVLTGKSYGLEIPKKLRKVIALALLVLILVSYFFLYSLHIKNVSDSLAVIHLVNWIIVVFREEFILRGVIQTKSHEVIRGSLLKISKAIWFTTLLFSLWHVVNLSIWPWQTVALQMLSCIPSGLVLGLIKEKTNTLLTYLIHICCDLFFFSIYLLLFDKLFFALF